MKKKIEQLIQTYVDGWKEDNINKILQSLTDNCTIIESHGPIYHGQQEIREWFNNWKQEKGRVLSWEVISFYFLERDNIAFFEWDFFCDVKGKNHHLPGISLVRFANNKINFIHEYRMTREAFDWKANFLSKKSE